MGYTTSTIHGIEVPDSAQANNIPTDLGKIVTALEGGSIVKRLTSTQINALTSGQKPAGLLVFNSTTNKLQISNGSTFTDVIDAGGGTMGAALAMGGSKITGLAAGTANGDAVRYEQAVLTAGSTMTGDLTMSNSKTIKGLRAAAANGEAVRYDEYNTLGTYQSWTPSLSADTPTLVKTQAATANECRYTQIGKHVSGRAHVTVSEVSGTGNIRIPLPVTPTSTSVSARRIGNYQLFATGGYGEQGYVEQGNGATYCYGVIVTGSGANFMSGSDINALITSYGGSITLVWNFSYEAA